MLWASGKELGLKSRQYETHRARLRKIGIDIANPCDVEKFPRLLELSLVKIIMVRPFKAPDFYQISKQYTKLFTLSCIGEI